MTQNIPAPHKPTQRPNRSTTAFSHCFPTRGDNAATAPSKAPSITPSGLSVSTLVNIPNPNGPISINAETTFGRGALGDGASFLFSLMIDNVGIFILLFCYCHGGVRTHVRERRR